ncbi:thioredoxin reductase/SAM-dependent methyltransferase [Nocardioides marinisabuli]|uniref:Thioredoxin reductase/SAM-dependent methyltransferase n=1 Tax=Nocardioides marinisabuli TaxID=419476 RepID=A0A7Y9F1T4_9ACTN|nr:bifunctional NAD(P)/FAD-dependent oxidoreductase/class I SAM-dependent methyltransferase [Nocardioides marinisabuli]NYD58062.1 thioredoxin reductase/SAM-dependent methyltransferase [Nocardioides marinisabuli]
MTGNEYDESWDVVVVGGGAAGLSAALMLGRARRRVLVVDAGEPRNRYAAHVHGVLGHDGLEPAALVARGREELAAYDVEVRAGRVEAVEDLAEDSAALLVRLDSGASLRTRALVVATGITDVLPEVPGLAERWGSSVLHCPYCHGWEVRGRRIGILATGPWGLHQAQLLRQWSDDVVLLSAAMEPLEEAVVQRLASRGVRVVPDEVVEVLGDGAALTGVRTAADEVVEVDALFTIGHPAPHDGFLDGLALGREEGQFGSFLTVDPTGRTSHERVWAVGNVVEPMAAVPMVMSAGAKAGAVVNAVLVEEDFDAAQVAAHQVAEHWEGFYADTPRKWSGRVNATTADVVATLPVGDVLDLGCGEGGDAVWLAEQGWRVTAVDISDTATARGAEGAAARGVADRVEWHAHDLATWRTEETFDLVTASFLHSEVALPRTEVLRRAASRLRPGGHLLLVSHVFESEADLPPWAPRKEDGHDHGKHSSPMPELLTPVEEVAELALDPDAWSVVLCEIREREATGPDGRQTATMKDGVVLLQRR